MKRSGPLRRTKPLRTKRPTPRRPRDDNQSDRDAYDECHARPNCQAQISPSCTGRNEHAHHRRLRSQSGPTISANLLAVCLPCHDWIHYHRDEAHRLRFVLHAGDRIVPYNRMDCMDCGADTSARGIAEYYTLSQPLWRSITESTRGAGMLCIGCVEIRLGRELDAYDFSPFAPVNAPDWGRKSTRLLNRLARR